MIVDQSNRGLYMFLKCQIAAVRRKLRDRNPDLFSAFEIFDHTGTAVLCEVDRKSLKHGDRFKIELARCLNVVLAWHPSDDMKQGRWRIVFQPLRDERRMVFDAEPW